MSAETTRLIRDGEKGEKRLWMWGEREIIYLSLHCHHQNDSFIKMGSDESHFKVSSIVRDKITRHCPDNNFSRERRAEVDSNQDPTAYQPNALPLSQPGSRPLIQVSKHGA